MKKLICVLLSAAAALMPVCAAQGADGASETPSVSAEAYVLYCPDNGEIIASQNKDKKMKPASTTKLLTTLITLEYAAKEDNPVTFTSEMAAEGSSMYLEYGETVRLSDLAVGMMMCSGNDAANAAAVSIAGSAEKFAELMNDKARLIGMDNSNFVTPSGLDNENHYSTAYDLALLMEYALQNEAFASLTARKSAAVSFINPEEKQTVYTNHNKLLSLYEYCTGGKTGYTKAAGRCLVSSAEKDGITLICVTLNDKNDWEDHISLFDFGFSSLSCYFSADTEFAAEIPCVGGTSDSVTVSGKKDAKLVLSAGDDLKIERKIYCDSFLYAPVSENEPVGRIDYILDGETVASTNLIALTACGAEKRGGIFFQIKDLFTDG